MKFTYIGKGLNNYYGLYAANGDELDITEENIIAKMKTNKDFKAARKSKKSTGAIKNGDAKTIC